MDLPRSNRSRNLHKRFLNFDEDSESSDEKTASRPPPYKHPKFNSMKEINKNQTVSNECKLPGVPTTTYYGLIQNGKT